MNLAAARGVLADAVTVLNTIGGRVTGHAHQPASARPLDAWPVLRSVRPSTFGTCEASLDLIVVLSADTESASRAADDLAVQLIDALGQALATPVQVQPITYLIGGQELSALAATVLIEVES